MPFDLGVCRIGAVQLAAEILMACKGSGVRVPSAPLPFSQVKRVSWLFSMILQLTWAPYWAPSGANEPGRLK